MRLITVIFLIFLVLPGLSQNLIVNPGAELDPVTNGWTQVSGYWMSGTEVPARTGNYHFYAGSNSTSGSELYQDINVSAFAPSIDAGSSTFNFSVYMRVYNYSWPFYNDQGRVYVEYRNAASTILQTYDTGVQNTLTWTLYSDSRIAPVGTRTIRIRLIAYRSVGTAADGYFDDLSLTHNSTLPVTLISFSSQVQQNIIMLSWKTASEQNNDYFTLEKSNDGISWEVLGKVKGKRNSEILTEYQFPDYSAQPGVQYYRLSQTDLDGTSETFPVISQDVSERLPICVYPNPAIDRVFISNPDNEMMFIRVFSAAGSLVWESQGTESSFQVNDWPSGIYFVKIRTATDEINHTLIKK